jgi:hypothetical protein
MSKHTKGPWKVRRTEYYYIVESEGYLISKNELKADAHLIAAAPDMLAVLQHVERMLESFTKAELQEPLLKSLEYVRAHVVKVIEQAEGS